MRDARSDEEWAQSLADHMSAATPRVPVDVAGALRRGRRRRRTRAAVASAGTLGVLALGVLAVQQPWAPGTAAPPAAGESMGFTRSTVEVDGERREVIESEPVGPRADPDPESTVREMEIERLSREIAMERATLAELDRRLAALAARTSDTATSERSDLIEQRTTTETRLATLREQEGTLIASQEAAWVARDFELTDLPVVEPVQFVARDEWPQRMVDCLVERGGWDAHVTPRGGWQATTSRPGESEEFGSDYYVCLLMYPTERS